MVTASHNPPEYNGIKMVILNEKTGGLDIIRPCDGIAKNFAADSPTTPTPRPLSAPRFPDRLR